MERFQGDSLLVLVGINHYTVGNLADSVELHPSGWRHAGYIIRLPGPGEKTVELAQGCISVGVVTPGVPSGRGRDFGNHAVCIDIGACRFSSLKGMIFFLECIDHPGLGHHIHNRTGTCAPGKTAENMDTRPVGIAYPIHTGINILYC